MQIFEFETNLDLTLIIDSFFLFSIFISKEFKFHFYYLQLPKIIIIFYKVGKC